MLSSAAPSRKKPFSRRCFAAFLFFVFITALSRPVHAGPTVSELITAAQQGELSLDELAEAMAKSAAASPESVESLRDLSLPFPGFDEMLGKQLVLRSERTLVSSSAGDARGLKILAEEMLPPGNADRGRVLRLFELAETAEALVAEGSAETVFQTEFDTKTPQEQDIIAARLSRFIQKHAEEMAESSPPVEALATLVKLDQEWKAAGISYVAVDVLKRLANNDETLSASDTWPLADKDTQSFLRSAMGIEPELKKAALVLYEKRAMALLNAGKMEGAAEAFSWILQVRPDPDSKNVELRWELLDAAGSDSAFGKALLDQLEAAGKLGLGARLKLAISGHYGFFAQILLLALLIVPFVLSAFVVSRARAIASGKAKSWAERSAEKRGVGYLNITEQDDDYTRLLSVFGLDESASEAQIKKAYRNKMKELHPDRAAAGAEADEEKLQELKEIYDRIMEMRSSWFGR